MLAAKSAGPKMIVSSRGEAAQISSTLMRPRAVSICASIPMWPTGRPDVLLHLGQQEVEGDDLGRRLDLGQHDLVQALAGVAHHLDDVAVGPLGVPGVDPDAEHPLVPGQVLDGVDHLGPGALLLERRHGVLEVEEGHVGRDGGRLGQELLVRAGRGQAGAAGQVTRACGHDPMVTNGSALPGARRRDGSDGRALRLPDAGRKNGRQACEIPERSRRFGGVVDLGTGVVEEGVVGPGVDDDLDVLAELAQLLAERLGGVGGEEVVVARRSGPSTAAGSAE